MNIAFDAKRVLVTGADHGIGRAIARCFADRGARVVACGLHAASLEETAAGRMATGKPGPTAKAKRSQCSR